MTGSTLLIGLYLLLFIMIIYMIYRGYQAIKEWNTLTTDEKIEMRRRDFNLPWKNYTFNEKVVIIRGKLISDGNYTTRDYADTANSLADGIKAMILDHPEILEIQDVFDLFKVEGYKLVNDKFEPSLAQASWALQRAKQMYNEEN